MKKLELVSTKTLLPFEEFIARNRFQFPNGIYHSRDLGIFHLAFINSFFENILFSDEISGVIKLPPNFVVEKFHLIEPASCIEMRSEVGYKRIFTIQTFLSTIWSLLYEQGEGFSGFIAEGCLYIFHIRYPHYNPYGNFETLTATMMFGTIGAYYEYSINIHPPKIYEETWDISNQECQNIYLLAPVKS